MGYPPIKDEAKYLTITIGTKYISVDSNIRGVHGVLNGVNYKLVEWESRWDHVNKKRVSKVKAKYYWTSKDNTKVHYHIAFKDQVLDALKSSFFWDNAKIIKLTPDYGVDVDIPFPVWTPRDNQEEWVNFLTTKTPSYTRVLPAPTGGGKTVCGLRAAHVLGKRTVIYASPKYFNVWLPSIKQFYKLDMKRDLAIVSGEKGHTTLPDFIDRGLSNDIHEKVVLISLNSMQGFISKFEEGGYNCRPEEFHRVTGIGTRIDDEAHQWLCFRAIKESFNNLTNNIDLTATLMKEIAFLRRMENAIYPVADRCPVPPPEKHVNVIGVSYQFNPQWPLPSVKGAFGYSHNKLEKFFKYKNGRREAFFDLLGTTLDREYIRPYGGKYKALVYFSTKEMVFLFKKYLKARFPSLDIREFLRGSGDSVLDEADIIVATPGKAGTGTDIKNLIVTLQTIAVASKAENYQNVGRIREIKADEDGHTPDEKFIYVFASNLPKHREYHVKKKNDLNRPESIVKTHKEHHYHRPI